MANNAVEQRTIVAKKRTESQTKPNRSPNKIRTEPKLIRQATLTRLKLVKQEPCQVSKVRPKNTKTDKNKYEEIVKQHFTNIKNQRIVFHMAGNKAIPKAILN